MRIIWLMLGAAVAVSACLAGGQAAASGSASDPCLGSRAKRINQQDVRSIKCVIDSSQMLREAAMSDAQTGYSQCVTEENAAGSPGQTWDGVDRDGSDLVSFANSGLVAAADGDGNEANALAYYKPAYKDPLQAERLQTAIRSLTNAKDYGVKFKEKISTAGADLEAHACQRVLDDDLDHGGATGAEGRNGDARTQESNALIALEKLAK